MGFSSVIFVFFFLPLVLGLYALLWKVLKSHTVQNLLLIAVSLFFYRWGLDSAEGFRVLLLILAGNYLLTFLIRKTFARGAVFLAVLFNVAILVYFKYPEQVSLLLRDGLSEEVIFPLGLSFIIFHAITYAVDTYREQRASGSELREVMDLCLYILFFPKLLQGPIVPFHAMKEAIRHRLFNLTGVAYGMERFLIGLSKKVLIADEMGAILQTMYNASAIDTPTAWLAVLLYGLQLYFDFSGYSDMAIGLASCFGFPVAENFNFPYISRSISEFWRRWHISLGAWFRNYVYIPLGGNRRGNVYVNLMIVFLLTGIWHGNTFIYLLWGLTHGAFVLLERTRTYRSLPWEHPLGQWIGWAYTTLVVFIGWLCFRLETLRDFIDYIRVLLGRGADTVPFTWQFFLDAKTVLLIVVSVAGILILSRPRVQHILAALKAKPVGQGIAYLTLIGMFVLCFFSMLANSYSPFMYFQY